MGQCYFWAIRAEDYRKLAAPIINQEREENFKLIEKHKFFDSMSQDQKAELLNIVFTRIYKIGATIAEEGSIADSFFIVKEGQVIVRKD